jgi:mono/diheme cytochrome c family protein
MPTFFQSDRCKRPLAAPLLACLALVLALGAPRSFAAGDPPGAAALEGHPGNAPGLSQEGHPGNPPGATEQELRLGERIYREGVLPSGGHLRVSVKGEQAVPGLTFTCASCHLRSGLGAFDEGVYTPAINGEKLFKPLPRIYKGIESTDSPPLRPAYTEKSLREVLRSGSDPNGRTLSEAMPRYLLDDQDARLLVAYLRTLSTRYSPGVTDSSIRFATVISEDVRPDRRDVMLSSLAFYFNIKNNQIRGFSNPRSGIKSRMMAENMLQSRELTGKSLSLSRWVLKGAPETWRAQLEEYNRKEPVFALLGGLVNGPWQPVHRFCEENEIPALFPNTEVPVLSETDWYTLYQSKGYYQEGEGAARYLGGPDGAFQGGTVLQVVRDTPEARALAAGFQKAWQELGQKPPLTRTLPPGKALDPDFLQRLLVRDQPAVLLVWDGAEALTALESLGSRSDGRPAMVFLSARYLGESIWTLKEPLREFTFLTYPYAFSSKVVTTGMGKALVQEDTLQTLKQSALPVKNEVQKINSQTAALMQLLTTLLMDLKGNYYRDNLLDVAGMMPDQPHPLYGRLSFGTGQRYASRGCFIVQLSHGAVPELVKKSGWLAH